MKRLTFLLIFVASLGYSQSNLVFNKVLNFRLVPGNGTVTPAQTATVPDGKVWKIESYDRDGAGSINIVFEIQNPEYGSTITFGSYNSTPIWLQEGTILKATSDGIFFSILEFDVVPVSTTSTGSGGLSSEGLEFNQVINYSGDGYLSNANRSEVLTSLNVPENKVWKITNVAMSRRTGIMILADNDGLNAQLGNQIIYSRYISGYSPPTVNYPIWISSGTHDLTISDDNQNGLSYRISISAIEYNIPQ